MTRTRFNVLGVWIDAIDMQGALREIARSIEEGKRSYVCHANVHGVVEASRDSALRQAYNLADLALPDGMPLAWMARLTGHMGVTRVYGPDLMLSVSELAARLGYRCFYYGGAPGVAAALAQEMERRFPGLVTAGTHSPPFREPGAAESDDVIGRINGAGPHIVWVGLGCPRQELWMAAHRARLDAPMLVGVGAAFDFHTGRVPQAPIWMRESGLEWLYRLAREPRRLWRRYLVGNPLFLLGVVLQMSGLRRCDSEDSDA